MVSVQDHGSSTLNVSGTGEQIGTPLTQVGSRAVRFELVDETGRLMGLYVTPKEAAEAMRPGWTLLGLNTGTIWQRADRGPVKVA